MEVPDWKVHLLERRRKEEEEMKRKDREEEERLSKMPAWKREIILRRKAKAEASMSGNKEEVDLGEQEEKEKVDNGVQEEKETHVLMEKIGPVLQNPFIQLEKQRRSPEPSYGRPKSSPESPVLRSSRAEDLVRDPNPQREEEVQEGPVEDSSPATEDRRGRVSRLLSRFGHPSIEGESGLSRINGEVEMTAQALHSSLKVAEHEIKVSTSLAPPSQPPPFCPQIAMGSQNSAQETTLSSSLSSSPSCSDNEPYMLSASVSMSGFNARHSAGEEAKQFPFNLRPASPAASRQSKLTAQPLSAPARPNTVIHNTIKAETEEDGGQSLSKVVSPLQGTPKKGNVENQAMQRRKGNTITVNPRKMVVCENGFVATETKTPSPKTETGKKRYPTVDEIKVIGGYQALGKSCLAKHARDKKKMNISFPESELECTYEYPSESSLLLEFGPPEEPEATVPSAQPEEDEEEESALLGSIMRRKALIVDESCKR
ncbi:phostensin [Bombina bombina]|uniref:phostensin n=1 Tax=Bombina bombina TaxID=8345 RepID=UPI00235B2FAA|nr:phostensin [Bombina bombina]